MKKNEKIAVIGAGLAGLTAAYRLTQKGFDVTLYEATNKVGGRIHSVYVKNTNGEYSIAEMGGQNLTDGGDSTYIFNLIEELGLEVEHDYIDLKVLTYSNGEFGDFDKMLSNIGWTNDVIDSKLNEAEEKSNNIEEVLRNLFEDNDSLIALLKTRITCYEGLDTKLQSVYHNIETLRYILKGGISSAHKENKIHLATIDGGNAKLPLKMAEILDDKIQLNMPLHSVSLDEQKIKITFRDGYSSVYDKLIFANPASTFNAIDVDDSLLPIEQLDKIRNIQYGKNAKILLPADFEDIKYRAVVTDKLVSFFNHDKKLMLLYLMDDKYIADVEKQIEIISKGTVSDIILPNITDVSDEHFVKYDSAVTKIWSKDEFFQGSYSGYDVYLAESLAKTIELNGVVFKEMFIPIDDKIFFVGEHTSIIDSIGTMEAAVESAERTVKYFDTDTI